jgi:hypothetical protein
MSLTQTAMALRSDPSQTRNISALMNKMGETHEMASPIMLAVALHKSELISADELSSVIRNGFDFYPEIQS